MTFAPARPRILAVTAAAGALVAACSSTPAEPHGSPVLTSIYWSAGGQQSLAWVPAGDSATTMSPVPPFVSEIDFVFDRVLDGARLEDLVTEGGVTSAIPKAMHAILVSWPDRATRDSHPPFDLVIDYNSVPRFGGTTSYVFARPMNAPGIPTSEAITFRFDTTLLTSAYDEPASVPDHVDIKTSDFVASIAAATGPISSRAQIPLSFSNRLSDAPATSPFVHVTTGGEPVPYKLLGAGDPSLASRWYLAPADCLGSWPASATLVVTIDADFADAFGDELGMPATATFSTAATAGAAGDASCSIPDGGASDGDASDAADAGYADEGGSDAGASDAGASGADEGGSDAGASDAVDGGVG
jgi:hypothetical protein